jgi:hypothetical protein
MVNVLPETNETDGRVSWRTCEGHMVNVLPETNETDGRVS